MSILLFDRDPSVIHFLRQELKLLQMPLQEVRTTSAFKDAVQNTHFALAFVDIDDRQVDTGALATSLHALQPECQIFLMGRELPIAQTLQLLRRMGHEYLVKPLDAAELEEAVATRLRRRDRVIKQRQRLEAELKALQQEQLRRSNHLGAEERRELRDFLESALQTFVRIERQNVELQQRVAMMEDPLQASKSNRLLTAWIAHPDPRFSSGMLGLQDRLQMRFEAQMSTGGEILDRLGQESPDVLVIGDMLPDIPAELVTESARSNRATMAIVVVKRWGEPDMSAELLGQRDGDSLVRPLRSAEDLVAVLEAARARCAASDLGREFFKRFSDTHSQFLEGYRSVRQLLEDDPA